jgi:hypothetical protein
MAFWLAVLLAGLLGLQAGYLVSWMVEIAGCLGFLAGWPRWIAG